MRKLLIPALCALLCLSGCAPVNTYSRYSCEFIDTFDTVVTALFYARSPDEADRYSAALQTEMRRLHKLFDRYYAYSGVINVRTINDNAGVAPVNVGLELMALLEFTQRMSGETGGRLDITLGPVIDQWNAARLNALAYPETAAPPDNAALAAAGELCGMDYLELDSANGTAYLTRAGCSLDLGAVAKGYACQLAADMLVDMGCADFLISGGGNVVAVGSPPDADGWSVGIRAPDDERELLATYTVSDMSVVTSGDYQRCFTADGRRYHHIIDPDTLMPGALYRSVSVICPDSGLADFLSTTLFLSPLDTARESCARYGARALVVTAEGEQVAIG